jgi:hypothetical protein
MAIPKAPIPNKDQIYVCRMSWYDEENGAIRCGARLLGSHRAVQKRPELFTVDGLDDVETARIMRLRFPDMPPTSFRP